MNNKKDFPTYQGPDRRSIGDRRQQIDRRMREYRKGERRLGLNPMVYQGPELRTGSERRILIGRRMGERRIGDRRNY